MISSIVALKELKIQGQGHECHRCTPGMLLSVTFQKNFWYSLIQLFSWSVTTSGLLRSNILFFKVLSKDKKTILKLNFISFAKLQHKLTVLPKRVRRKKQKAADRLRQLFSCKGSSFLIWNSY